MQGPMAYFYDGLTARRHAAHVALSTDRAALIITSDSLPDPVQWRLMDLRTVTKRAGGDRLSVTRHTASFDEAPRDTARLVILDPELIDWMLRTRPDLGKVERQPGMLRKLAVYAAGAVAASALILLVILPALANVLARVIPIDREIAFGRTVVTQMQQQLEWMGGAETLVCDDPAGLAALDVMLNRLTATRDMSYAIDLQVFDHPMVNAFAAPGGQVVILQGLIDESHSPEELAGVLAHELAHVESRDATRLALRAAGSAGLLSMLVGDFTGGALFAGLGEQLLSAHYTRDAEAAADMFALEMMEAAQIDATGFADFFETLAEHEGHDGHGLPEYFSSHPVTSDRAARAQLFALEQTQTRPILSDAQWRDLQQVCE